MLPPKALMGLQRYRPAATAAKPTAATTTPMGDIIIMNKPIIMAVKPPADHIRPSRSDRFLSPNPIKPILNPINKR